MHCDKHKKYKAGCEDCKKKNKEYSRKRRNGEKANSKTHYNNGIEKPQGIYSEENWKRFNELGRKLTENAVN